MNKQAINAAHPHRSTNREANERFVHLKGVNMEYDNGRLVRDVTGFVRTDKDGQTYVSFAEGDSRDQFCKARGRTVARRKWFDGKSVPLQQIEKLDGQGHEKVSLYDSALATYMAS
jgi:hypothetical protein